MIRFNDGLRVRDGRIVAKVVIRVNDPAQVGIALVLLPDWQAGLVDDHIFSLILGRPLATAGD